MRPFTLFAFAYVLVGCQSVPIALYDDSAVSNDLLEGDWGGYQTASLQMPFATWTMHQCTQGAHGEHSHQFPSTAFDVDFDTPNDRDEEIFSPVSGRVYVFTDDPYTNFGYHLNIDLGDGTFVVLGHFKKIFVRSGQEVTTGQLIGIEGCTGACTGDHVHIGRHEGDPTQPAEYSRSIPSAYFTVSEESVGDYMNVSSEDLICGLPGDPVIGDFYPSANRVTKWHPDGTLLKQPLDPDVYLVQDSALHRIEDESVFYSHEWSFADVALMNEVEADCMEEGNTLSTESQIDGFMDQSGQMWLVVGDPDDMHRYRQRVQEQNAQWVYGSWGLPHSQMLPPDVLSADHVFLNDYPVRVGFAGLRDGTIVTETGRSDVYIISHEIALPVSHWSVYLRLGFHDRAILEVPSGQLSVLQDRVGDCQAGVWCLDTNAVISCGGLELPPVEMVFEFMQEESSDDTSDPEEDEDDSFEEEEDPISEDPDPEPTPESTPEPDPESDPVFGPDICGGDHVCLADIDADGQDESLMVSHAQWLVGPIVGADAYVWSPVGNGCTDGVLNAADLVSSFESTGYYRVDFSGFVSSCAVEMTLINSIGTDGLSPNGAMGNWYWWQNAAFCSSGSPLCALQNNGTSWEEWLLSVMWNPSVGLVPNGNGFTSNTQL